MLKLLKRKLVLIIILVLVGFFVYVFNFNNPLFWDDTDWIVNNPFVHSLSPVNVKNWFTENILAGIGLSSNYYRPFLLFTFAFNYMLGGENPVGYHLTSNFLHIANAVLIFLILFFIFKSRFISFWASLIWLVHPLQTEAVTYISGRGDPLNVFFMLLAICLWIPTCEVDYPHRLRKSVMWTTLVLLVLALLSRETAVIFPFLLMVFYVSFISKERFAKALKVSFVRVLPYFGVVFIYGTLRLTVLNFENTLNFFSQSNIYTSNFSVRMYTFLNVLWTYAWLMIVPLGQHMERSVTIYTYFWNWPTVVSFLVLLAILLLIRRFYKKEIRNSKFDRDSRLRTGTFSEQIQNLHFRVWFFAVGWFFVNLAMTSGITPINAQLYEHWLYLALLGPLVLVTYYLHYLFDPFDEIQGHSEQGRMDEKYRKKLKLLIIFGLVFVVAAFSLLSIKRNIIWGKPIEFFENILKYEPDSARINNNLGTLYYNKDDKKRAEEYYWKATQTKGNSFSQPYFNLGALLQERGDIRGAVVVFEKAIELNPNFPYPYPNLAVIYASQGDLTKAIYYLEKLKELQPQLQRVYYNLALTYIEMKNAESAYKNLQDGLKYGRPDPETEPLIKELLQRFKE